MLPLVVIPVSIAGLLLINKIQMLSRWKKIKADYVEYISSIDAHPDFFIIYSRNGKSYSEHHSDCYYNECNSHLTGRWYQNNYEHHI